MKNGFHYYLKNMALWAIVTMALTQCQQTSIQPKDILAKEHLSQTQQKQFIQDIIYNLGKWPESANKNTVRHSHYAEDFLDEAKRHTLKYYYKKQDTVFFGVWKIAPSLVEKYRLTAGKVVLGTEGPVYYEEVFRTWKMKPEILEEKGQILFLKWLEGKDLSPYYNHNSGNEEWIEFPDSDVSWNQEAQTWISPKTQVLDALYKEKREKMEALLKKKDSAQNTSKP
jgi:hypothetical protein